nr:uncharacterized protein PB18E9.04c-like [Aedes albopictus]
MKTMPSNVSETSCECVCVKSRPDSNESRSVVKNRPKPERQFYTMMTKDRFGGSPTTAPSATAIVSLATVTPPLQSQSITISTNHASSAVSNTTQVPTLATTAAAITSNSSNCSTSISINAAVAINSTSGTTSSTIHRRQSTKPPPATLPLLPPTSANIPSPSASAAMSSGQAAARTPITNPPPAKSPATGAVPGDGKR